jgi:nitric-oxide synthase
MKLGWQSPSEQRGRFDVLPLIVEMNGQVLCQELPEQIVLQVQLEHPTIPAFRELGLQWHAVPAISNMGLTIGGVQYTAIPFNGWYGGTHENNNIHIHTNINIVILHFKSVYFFGIGT